MMVSSLSQLILFVVLFLCSILVFIFGVHYGQQGARVFETSTATACAASALQSQQSPRAAAQQLPIAAELDAGLFSSSRHEKYLLYGLDTEEKHGGGGSIRAGGALVDVFGALNHPSSHFGELVWKSAGAGSVSVDENKKEGFLKGCNSVFLTRTGSRANLANKCLATVQVLRDHESPFVLSHRIGVVSNLTNMYQGDYIDEESLEHEKKMLPPFLRDLEAITTQFREMMGDPMKEMADPKDPTQIVKMRRTVTIIVANEGVMDLVLNFICSCQTASIDLEDIVVFLGQEEFVPLIRSMGAHAFFHPSLGSIPRSAAGYYGDFTFGVLMWLKTTSVYVASRAGFNVLFQDADLVWMRDPLPYLQEVTSNAPSTLFNPHAADQSSSSSTSSSSSSSSSSSKSNIASKPVSGGESLFSGFGTAGISDSSALSSAGLADIVFMDDGARTPRFTPMFVNSGFYYQKYSPGTLYLMEKMMKSFCDIITTHSHQATLTRHITEAHHLVGFQIAVLRKEDFPSGMVYHHQKGYIKKLKEYKVDPYVFHMCWTSSRKEKVEYFKELGLWFLPDLGNQTAMEAPEMAFFSKQCTDAKSMLDWTKAEQEGRGGSAKNIREFCCQKGYFWEHKPL